MKLFVLAGLIFLPALASAHTCKVELYGPQGNFITSIRTPNDPDCRRAAVACTNWRDWYYAPVNSICYRVRDDGHAGIDYVRYPNYDDYFGYPGSPYTRVPRTLPARTVGPDGTICDWDRQGRSTCYRPETRPRPETTPNPQPDTMPRPRPNPETTPTTPTTPGADSIRAVEAGETVIFNGALHMVVTVENTNFYNLKPVGGRDRDIVKDVARQYMAVTRGCNVGFCAKDSVIVIASATYAAVAGLEYDGQFVTKSVDGNDTFTFDVNASSLAWTKGCSPEGARKVCVGNVVMKQNNRNNGYFTVVGIQLDGNVILEEEKEPKKLITNVRPDQLVITR